MAYNILVVDDDQEFREELRQCLDEYNIVDASNGKQALNILSSANEIDLVLLDVMMPEMSGIEVLRYIKKQYSNLGVIMLTGYSSKQVVIDSLKGKADDYIEKPINIMKTKQVIAEVLKEKQGISNLDELDTKDLVQKIQVFIKRNFDKDVNLENAAELVCLSPKYLSRVFKEYTGSGFSDYKQKVRMQKAEHYLKNTGYNIGQISENLGYKNIESFIRTFKKYFNATPMHYRKNHE